MKHTEAFENGAENKRRLLWFRLVFLNVLVWKVGKNAQKSMRFRCVERWKQDENASAGESIFLRFGRDGNGYTFKNALRCGRGHRP